MAGITRKKKRRRAMIRFMPKRKIGEIVRIDRKFYKVHEALFGFVKLFRYHSNRLPQGREQYGSEERLWNHHHTKQSYIQSGNSWTSTPLR